MKLKQAYTAARKAAKRRNEIMYVWLDDYDKSYKIEEYAIGSDFDAETWYAGQNPVAAFDIDGSFISD